MQSPPHTEMLRSTRREGGRNLDGLVRTSENWERNETPSLRVPPPAVDSRGPGPGVQGRAFLGKGGGWSSTRKKQEVLKETGESHLRSLSIASKSTVVDANVLPPCPMPPSFPSFLRAVTPLLYV